MDALCRTCMNESHSHSSMYGEIFNGESQLCDIINDVCQLEVSMGDELPMYVCSDCSFKLCEFKKFKIRSHQAEAAFLRLKGNFGNYESDEPGGPFKKENFEAIKVKVEPEDVWGAETRVISYDPEEYIGIDRDDLNFNGVKTEKYVPGYPYPLQFEIASPEEKASTSQRKQEPRLKRTRVSPKNEKRTVHHEKVPGVVVEGARVVGDGVEADKPSSGSEAFSQPCGERSHGEEKPNKKSKKEPRFFCDYCGKGFAAKTHLGNHVRIHTGVRPHQCTSCGKGFAQKGDLDRHALSHGNREPCVCKECGKRFNQKRYLALHAKIHSETEKFPCGICGKTFGARKHLKRHSLVHIEENSYICDECGRRFSHKEPLGCHLKTHGRITRFVCEVCGKGFLLRSVMKKHLSRHSDMRPFPCELCEKSFKNRDDFKKHLKRHGNATPVERSANCGSS